MLRKHIISSLAASTLLIGVYSIGLPKAAYGIPPPLLSTPVPPITFEANGQQLNVLASRGVWLTDLNSDYLGQTPPGSTPEIFAPDIVSVTGRYEYGVALSPDGDEIFFTAEDPGHGLMITRRVDGEWTTPKVANLRGVNQWEFEAFYTRDG